MTMRNRFYTCKKIAKKVLRVGQLGRAPVDVIRDIESQLSDEASPLRQGPLRDFADKAVVRVITKAADPA